MVFFEFSRPILENVGLKRKEDVAPPTQGTWRSDDYVSAFRLVDIGSSKLGGGAVYVHIGWSTQTCATTAASSHSRVITPTSQTEHHILNITFKYVATEEKG